MKDRKLYSLMLESGHLLLDRGGGLKCPEISHAYLVWPPGHISLPNSQYADVYVAGYKHMSFNAHISLTVTFFALEGI